MISAYTIRLAALETSAFLVATVCTSQVETSLWDVLDVADDLFAALVVLFKRNLICEDCTNAEKLLATNQSHLCWTLHTGEP